MFRILTWSVFHFLFSDINECKLPSLCHSLATCSNTEGSFLCECKKGYNGDGKINCTGNSVEKHFKASLLLLLSV